MERRLGRIRGTCNKMIGTSIKLSSSSMSGGTSIKIGRARWHCAQFLRSLNVHIFRSPRQHCSGRPRAARPRPVRPRPGPTSLVWPRPARSGPVRTIPGNNPPPLNRHGGSEDPPQLPCGIRKVAVQRGGGSEGPGCH